MNEEEKKRIAKAIELICSDTGFEEGISILQELIGVPTIREKLESMKEITIRELISRLRS